jgi:hypothetical protein
MGGLLAEPQTTLPGIFGENAPLGFKWLQAYPFALPSLINALLLTTSTLITFFFLEEASIIEYHFPPSQQPPRHRVADLFVGIDLQGAQGEVRYWPSSGIPA